MEWLIYGLNQAPRAFYKIIGQVLREMIFKKFIASNELFFGNLECHNLYLAMYVDDLVMGSMSISALEPLKQKLSPKFEMKNPGHIRHILGTETVYDQ